MRGSKPKVPQAFLCSLIMGFDFEQLSTFTKMKKTTMISAMDRIHPILLLTLRKRWQSKLRPKPILSNYPYIALLVDSTSIEVYRPRGRFEEAKIYFDAKNGIYALKKNLLLVLRLLIMLY